jgi:hypothetical protein
VRWRARVSKSGSTGAWTGWHDLTINTSKTTSKTTAAAVNDFPFERMDLDKCANGSFQWAVVNHYNWCRRVNTGGAVFTKIGGLLAPTGYINFKAVAVINTHVGNQNSQRRSNHRQPVHRLQNPHF